MLRFKIRRQLAMFTYTPFTEEELAQQAAKQPVNVPKKPRKAKVVEPTETPAVPAPTTEE